MLRSGLRNNSWGGRGFHVRWNRQFGSSFGLGPCGDRPPMRRRRGWRLGNMPLRRDERGLQFPQLFFQHCQARLDLGSPHLSGLEFRFEFIETPREFGQPPFVLRLAAAVSPVEDSEQQEKEEFGHVVHLNGKMTGEKVPTIRAICNRGRRQSPSPISMGFSPARLAVPPGLPCRHKLVLGYGRQRARIVGGELRAKTRGRTPGVLRRG